MRATCLAVALGACALDFPPPPGAEPAVSTAAQTSLDPASPTSGPVTKAEDGAQTHAEVGATDDEIAFARGAGAATAGAAAPQPPPVADGEAQPVGGGPPAPPIAPDPPVTPPPSSPQSASPPAAADANTTPPAPGAQVAFELRPLDFRSTRGGELALPLECRPPINRSPGFAFDGVPEGARSLALVYRDVERDLVQWVVWDIPVDVAGLPAGLSSFPRPRELPGSSQLGLGSTGYNGPTFLDGRSEFTLWALDVATLPDATWLGTPRLIAERLLAHRVATAPALSVTNGL